jgi:aminocarboxymuconate-semialdehyde decarboxylase
MTDGSTDSIVDVHAHVVPDVIYDAARRHDPWFGLEVAADDGHLSWAVGPERWSMPWDDAWRDPAVRVANMNREGVDVQLISLNPAMFSYALSAADAPRMAAAVNDGIAEIAASAPERFRGLAHLPLQSPAAAVAELERAVDELGMVGAGIGTNVAGLNFDAPDLYPVFEAAAGLGAFVFIHPSNDRFPPRSHPYYLQNIVGHPVETTVAMASLIFGGVFERLEGLRVCFAHGGGYGCMGIGRFDHARRVRKECQEISGLPSDFRGQMFVDSLTHSRGGLRFLLDQAGPGQVVLGTDYPADMGQFDPVAWLGAAPTITDAERTAILSGNVRGLLGSRFAGAPSA